MQAAIHDRDQFAPPRPPGRMRAITLAVLAHAVLVVALTWGVNWKSSSDQPAVEAELWAAVPQQAAPRAETPAARDFTAADDAYDYGSSAVAGDSYGEDQHSAQLKGLTGQRVLAGAKLAATPQQHHGQSDA